MPENKSPSIEIPTANKPMDAGWLEQEAAAEADRDDAAPVHSSPAASRTEPGHKDSPMESLGKAVTETVWGASGEADGADKPGGRAVEGVEQGVTPASRRNERKADPS